MKRRPLFRAFMIAFGLAASVMIVFSQNFPELPDSFREKVNTEQPAETTTDTAYIPTPANLIPAGSSIQLHEVSRLILETLLSDESEESPSCFNLGFFVGYLDGLFSVIISPNAP